MLREQQTLDREERTAWRDTQKRQVEIRMAELQAENKKRADEMQKTRNGLRGTRSRSGWPRLRQPKNKLG